jgi:hypothetical protein
MVPALRERHVQDWPQHRPDRRSEPRRRGHARVWLDPGGYLPAIDCRIDNVSPAGARLVIPESAVLPDRFRILPDGRRDPLEARIIWRNGSLVGIRWHEAPRQARAQEDRTGSDPQAPADPRL